MVVDQRFDNAKMRACPDDPQRCAMIYPRRGAFAVFDGGLGHGVLGSAAPDLRATLLINWWPHQPQVQQQQFVSPNIYVPVCQDVFSRKGSEFATPSPAAKSCLTALFTRHLTLSSLQNWKGVQHHWAAHLREHALY